MREQKKGRKRYSLAALSGCAESSVHDCLCFEGAGLQSRRLYAAADMALQDAEKFTGNKRVLIFRANGPFHTSLGQSETGAGTRQRGGFGSDAPGYVQK